MEEKNMNDKTNNPRGAVEKASSFSFGSFTVLMNDIDDWCGTKPHRPFPPRPHGIRDALISVAIHNLAAQVSDAKLRDQIQSLAEQLYVSVGKAMAGR